MIAWVLHILELIAGLLGVSIGFSRLPDAASALQIVTLTAVGLVGLSAFVRHFIFHKSDARRLGWDLTRPEFQYEVGFANLGFALVGRSSYTSESGDSLPTLRSYSATASTSCRRRFSTPGSQ
jgi:hypothetical protein